MAMSGRWVNYGRSAAAALQATLGEIKAGDPLAPAIVIVPSNHVGVATRRLLAEGRVRPATDNGVGLAVVTFLTTYRLAELLGAASLAGQGRRPVSTAVIGAALRGVLTDAPGLFAPVADHPATEEALVGAYRELRDLPESTLDAVAATSKRAAEVVRIHRATREALQGDWYDEEDLMAAAGDAVAHGPVAMLAPTVVYLPQRLSLHATHLLRAVGEKETVVVLAGASGVPHADREVHAALAHLGIDQAAMDNPEPAASISEQRTHIVTASDADEEVRVAVRAVIDAVRAGTPLGRIAILHASPEPYARLTHDHLHAAGVATNGASVTPLGERLAGRTLLGLLDWPQYDFRRWDLLAWVSGSPLRYGGRPVPATAWERVSRQAAVVAGRDHWDHLLTAFADGRDAEAEQVRNDPDRPDWQADRALDEAQRARSLRDFALELITDLDAAMAAPRAWGEHAGWAKGRLADLLGSPEHRTGWPIAEAKAAERVEQAIDRLAALDEVEGPIDLSVFARTLRLVLDADLGRVGRFGEGVLVGSLAMGVGLDLDLVIVVGLAEGAAPAPIGDDPLLSERERAAAGGQLAIGRDRIDRQHRQFLASLAGAARQVLTVPRGDLRTSSARVASRWVLDAASGLAGERWSSEDLWAGQEEWLTHVASFEAGIRASAFPATEQQHHLAQLMARAPGDRHLGTDADPLLARGAGVIAARRSDRFTPFDGNLAGIAIPSPTTRPTSTTRLERWVGCPFSHLLQDLLRVQATEDPEERLSISPLDRGTLIHLALETFVRETIADPAVEWTVAHHARLRAIGETRCDEYEDHGLTGRRLLWQRDRRAILRDLERVLQDDGARRLSSSLRPLVAELEFGLGGGQDAVALDLPDGRQVLFRGKIDRVDRAADGSLAVIDYKSGGADSYRKLTADDPVASGKRLQLPVYASAARALIGDPQAPARAEYWFVSAQAEYKRYGYDVTDDVLAKTGEVLATIVAGIEAGLFPAHPDASTTYIHRPCPFCDPDGLGVGDLRRQWERKAADPALAAYVALVEPELVSEEVGQ